MGEPVSIARDGDVMSVTLDRPDKLNSFDPELVAALQGAVEQAQDDNVRLAVFQGNGRGFSGGFDLNGIDDQSDGDLLLRFVKVEELLQSVHHAPFATVALVHGACYGAGADLVAACRYRVASPDARFRMPGARFGVVLGTRRLARLVGADAARQLLLRGSAFDSAEALETGFICEVSKQEDWPRIVDRQRESVFGVDQATYNRLADRMTDDARDSDLAALVRSVADGSIRARIKNYLKDMRAAKKL